MSKNFLPLKNRQIAQNRDSNPLASRTGKQAPLIRAFCKEQIIEIRINGL